MPAISVHMPVYNAEKYLGECLDSILSQSFADFEVICVDDGSTDSSLAILKEYANKDKRVKYFSSGYNMGTLHARKMAMTKATGDYMVFVDADDIATKDMFKKLHAKAVSSKADFVQCTARIHDPEGLLTQQEKENYEKYHSNLKAVTLEGDEVFKSFSQPIKLNFWVSIVAKHVYKSVAENIPNKRVQHGNDNLLMFFISYFAKKYTTIPDKLYLYRANPSSSNLKAMSKEKVASHITSRAAAIRYARAFIQRQGKKWDIKEKPYELFEIATIGYVHTLIDRACNNGHAKSVRRELSNLAIYEFGEELYYRTVRSSVVYIVTPSFNTEEFIDRTIQSVVSQDGDFCIRYHVQDGGSKDGTIDKLKKWKDRLENGDLDFFACKHIYFTYASAKDEGMYDAITKGFNKMTILGHSFMTWINSDDILLPGALAHILQIGSMPSKPNWILGAIRNIDTMGCHLETRVHFPSDIVREGLCDGSHWQFIQQEGTFWRKSLWDNKGGLDLSLRLAGDWDLWRRFAQGNEPVHTPIALGAFRKRKGQLSANVDSYIAEVKKIIPLRMREEAMAKLTEKAPDLSVRVFAPYKKEVKTVPLERAFLPGAAWKNCEEFCKKFLPKKKVAAVTQKVAAPVAPVDDRPVERRLLDTPVLHLIYLRSPEPVQRLLTKIKHNYILPIGSRIRHLRDWREIRRSQLFWSEWYLSEYDDVKKSGLSPLQHFVTRGYMEMKNPNPMFDTAWYIKRYPDVSAAGVNPFVHYLVTGWREGRAPHPDFSTAWYLDKHPELKNAKTCPLLHYMRHGIIEGITPGKAK